MSDDSAWESRYRELERTMQQALLFAARRGGVQLGEPEVTLGESQLRFVAPTSGELAVLSFELYRDGELLLATPYSYSNTLEFPYDWTSNYEVAVSVAIHPSLPALAVERFPVHF